MADQYLLFLVLLVGACFDLWKHRIPNWWIAGAAVTGLVLTLVQRGAGEDLVGMSRLAGGFVGRMVMMLAVCFPLFLFRMMGAGDVKLMALIYAYLEPPSGLFVLGCGLFIGAVWSCGMMAVHGSFYRRFIYFAAYFRRIFHTRHITAYRTGTEAEEDAVIPLGVCLFLGMALFLLEEWS